MATTGTGIASFLAGFPNVRKQAAQAGFGKAPSIKDVEKEAAALRGFLGTTDYASRLKESQDLAKLQIALAMAQRGFAGMSAQPQRGESSIGTLGRTLFSPLAGDIAPIAGRLMQQRQAAKAAEEKEDRDVKLAAYTQAATRAKDLDATALGILKAYSSTLGKGVKSQVIKNIRAVVEVGGKDETITTPILVLRDNEGTRTITVGENKVNGQTIPSGAPVKSWKHVSDKKPTTKHGLIGQIYANGKFTPVSNIMRATSFEGGKLKTDYYQNRPGSGWTHLEKGSFSEILPSHGPFETGKTFYVSLSGEKEGKVAAALGDLSATANARIESYISRVKPEVRDAKLPGLEDRIQYRYKNRDVTAELKDLIGTDAFQSVPLDPRDLQLAGQTADTRDFKPVSKIWATGVNPDLLNSILGTSNAKAGEVIEVWRKPPGIGPKGETIPEEIQYRNRGKVVTPEDRHLRSVMFQDQPLTARQEQEAGHVADTRVFHPAATLTITGDNFARLKKVLGPDVRTGEIVTVLKKPAQGDLP